MMKYLLLGCDIEFLLTNNKNDLLKKNILLKVICDKMCEV